MKAKIRQASGLLILFLILDICTQAPALHPQLRTERFGGHEVVAGEVLVKFKTSSASALSKSLSEVRLAHDVDVMEGVGFCSREVPSPRSFEESAQILRSTDEGQKGF
jgi:hypothetical protein